MMLTGTKIATLRAVQLIDIHGTRFYDLQYTHDDAPDRALAARLGVEDVYQSPQPNDHVTVRYVMNVAVGVTRAD